MLIILPSLAATATVIASALWELAQHPNLQERLFTEINDLYLKNNSGGDVTYKQLSQLSFLDAFIKESLRLHAPAGVARETTKSMTLRNSRTGKEYFIPAETVVMMIPKYSHEMDAYVNNANQFDPDRFLRKANNGDDEDRLRETFMPFSIGSRNCVGQPMAMAEAKSVIAQLVQRYCIRPAPGGCTPVPVFLLTIKLHQVNVRLVHRN